MCVNLPVAQVERVAIAAILRGGLQWHEWRGVGRDHNEPIIDASPFGQDWHACINIGGVVKASEVSRCKTC